MATNRWKRHRVFGAVVSLLLALTPWPGDLPRGEEAKRLNITVQHQRLSVDLKDADLREVLAQIGELADITVVFEPASGKRVSTQFTDMELEQGLQRLLGLASLNHVVVYGEGSAGSVSIREVRVLESPLGRAEDARGRGGKPLAQAQSASPPSAPGEESEGARRFREALEQPQPQTSPTSGQESEPAGRFRETPQRAQQRTSPSIGGPTMGEQPRVPPTGGESEGTQRLREAIEQPRQQTPVPAAGESEGARRFREALERARQQPPLDESEGARRFREALERARQRGN